MAMPAAFSGGQTSQSTALFPSPLSILSSMLSGPLPNLLAPTPSLVPQQLLSGLPSSVAMTTQTQNATVTMAKLQSNTVNMAALQPVSNSVTMTTLQSHNTTLSMATLQPLSNAVTITPLQPQSTTVSMATLQPQNSMMTMATESQNSVVTMATQPVNVIKSQSGGQPNIIESAMHQAGVGPPPFHHDTTKQVKYIISNYGYFSVLC